ncbi:hypothetical protein TELCIR_00429 [Teladorsagia circumcincta]|uniref:Aminoglycoside phosphotransferase domain-containing protein n=1 Tax=Teladorsagia circumcincta TaxID=45464 RepID=A0A2G9V6X8_TELCI|nr:hypothetical protein TELCIR_00429 [Teladorsagia circumcincta]
MIQGILSKICLISPDWQTELKDVPKEFVVKNHNAEVRFYELLKKYNITNIPTPKVYFTQGFTDENTVNGYLIMEYVSSGTVYHLFNNLTPDHMNKV